MADSLYKGVDGAFGPGAKTPVVVSVPKPLPVKAGTKDFGAPLPGPKTPMPKTK